MIKRILTYALLIISIYLIQTVLTGQLGFLKAKPDILMVLVIAVAFFSEDMEGIYAGLACGAFRDLAMTDSFGFYTVLSLFAVLMTGLFNKRIFKDNAFLFALIVLTVSASVEIMSCILNAAHNFLSGDPAISLFGYLYGLKTYSIQTVLMNSLIAFVIFFIVKPALFGKSYRVKGYA
jgi:rod shape-determining protein MreD